MSFPVRLAVLALLAALAACATAPPPAPLTDDRRQALDAFIVAYRLADAWPQAVPKITRDSLPRLEDATHADLDHDHADEAAHARVAGLLPQGRRELQEALLGLDADELARYTAYAIYAKVFDTEELRQITAFYASPVGRKLVDLGPVLVAEHRRPGAVDPLDKHFDAAEQAAIAAFWGSPVGRKMNATAGQVREELHAHFIERSEPALQAVARHLASQAQAAARP